MSMTLRHAQVTNFLGRVIKGPNTWSSAVLFINYSYLRIGLIVFMSSYESFPHFMFLFHKISYSRGK